MFPFESVAYAQAGGAEANPFVSFVPLILIVVVFWFFLIRPQQKRQKEHQKMISELGKGDRIVTTGGLFGTITKIGDCLLYTSPSPRDATLSRMPSSA